MKEINSLNIICPGSWNKRIFTPAWVASNLFELEKNEIEVAFNPAEMDMGYSYNNKVVLFPRDNSIEIKVNVIDEESKIFSVNLINKILSLLPQTPIRALGFNIRYVFKKDEDYPIVNRMNQIICNYDEFSTNQIKFSKEFDNYQLNLITEIKANEYIINFNFHHRLEHFPEEMIFDEEAINKKIEETQNIINDE